MVMDSRVSRDGELVGMGRGGRVEQLRESPPTTDPESEATLLSPGP